MFLSLVFVTDIIAGGGADNQPNTLPSDPTRKFSPFSIYLFISSVCDIDGNEAAEFGDSG